MTPFLDALWEILNPSLDTVSVTLLIYNKNKVRNTGFILSCSSRVTAYQSKGSHGSRSGRQLSLTSSARKQGWTDTSAVLGLPFVQCGNGADHTEGGSFHLVSHTQKLTDLPGVVPLGRF